MIETSFAGKEPPLLSPRTADYIAALIQEGENFDYSKWLQRVRGEEASTKCIPSKLVDPEMDNQAGASACNSTWPHSLLLTRAAPIPKTLRPPHRASKYQTAENRLRRRLEELRHAWDVFHQNDQQMGAGIAVCRPKQGVADAIEDVHEGNRWGQRMCG
jgi:hypothetical protein